jgi:protease-4
MFERLGVIQFRGTIRERSVEPYLRILRTLRDRPSVKGLLLDIASGGGESIASMDFYLAVKRLDAVKPVIASIGSMGASGAYMAALGARKIYAYPESAVGSIGVVMPHLAVQDLLRRIGISVELLHEGRHKDAFQGLRPLQDEERAKLQAVLHEDYELFVNLVATARKKPVDEIRNLATGEFWTGKRARDLGLVDELGDRELALEALAQATGVPAHRAVRFSPPQRFLQRVLSGSMDSVAPSVLGRLRESVEDSVLDPFGWYR